MSRDSIADNYILRIYRRDESDPLRIVGMVEVIETAEKRSFTTVDELVGIITPSVSDEAQGKQSSEQGKKGSKLGEKMKEGGAEQ
jgi:hypothetical protein